MSTTWLHLPVNERFTLYFDDDGDYVLMAGPERRATGDLLTAHGKTVGEAVAAMLEVLEIAEHMKRDRARDLTFYHEGGPIYDDGSDGYQVRGWYFWHEDLCTYDGPHATQDIAIQKATERAKRL